MSQKACIIHFLLSSSSIHEVASLVKDVVTFAGSAFITDFQYTITPVFGRTGADSLENLEK
jgi:hypothetical protein